MFMKHFVLKVHIFTSFKIDLTRSLSLESQSRRLRLHQTLSECVSLCLIVHCAGFVASTLALRLLAFDASRRVDTRSLYSFHHVYEVAHQADTRVTRSI